MPFTYRISQKHDLCFVQASGSMTDTEMLESVFEVWSDPLWHPGIDQINDFRRLGEMVCELDDMQIFVEVEEAVKGWQEEPYGRLVLVVPNPVHESCARFYTCLARDLKHETRIFATMAEAASWLDKDPAVMFEGEPVRNPLATAMATRLEAYRAPS